MSLLLNESLETRNTCYCQYSKLRHCHVMTRQRMIRGLFFAVDAAFVVHTEQALQRITSCITDTSLLFGLHFSLIKTEVLHQPVTREQHRPPCNIVGDVKLKSTQHFTHLRCIISSNSWIDKEIANRLSKANNSFCCLYNHFEQQKPE